MSPGRLLSLWMPVAAYLAFIGFTSAQESVPGAELFWDKLLHVVGYAPLAFLALRAFHGGVEAPRPGPTIAAGVLVTVWAISDEVHQAFVPGRSSDVRDVVADVVGFALAVFVQWLVFAARRRSQRGAPDRAL